MLHSAAQPRADARTRTGDRFITSLILEASSVDLVLARPVECG